MIVVFCRSRKKNELIPAHPDFQLVISYNPGYQSVIKDLKESTKQRFAALYFEYPDRTAEIEIIARETGADGDIAAQLVTIGQKSRNLRGHGLDEGASTRMLVQAARLYTQGIPLARACEMVITMPLTDDKDIRDALTATISAIVK